MNGYYYPWFIFPKIILLFFYITELQKPPNVPLLISSPSVFINYKKNFFKEWNKKKKKF